MYTIVNQVQHSLLLLLYTLIYCIVLYCIVFGLHYTSLVPYCIATAGLEKR